VTPAPLQVPPLGAVGGAEFETAAIVFGLALMGGALVSGIARRSFLSLTALFVLAGFLLGEGGAEVLELDPTSSFVGDLAIVALVVILFRDGIEVEAEMLQQEWHLPLRKLVLAMPLTCLLVAVATHVLTDLGWTESFLLGALLSPTDPVLSSAVVTNPRVPRIIRHSLNLESGLNDGLALPAVLAFTEAARVADTDFVWWEFVLQDVSLGLLFGVVVGFLAALVMPRGRGKLEAIPAHQLSLYALGTAFAAYGLTTVEPEGNGFIAVYVCAIVLGIRRPDIARTFEDRAQDIVEVVKLGIFVVFGALLTLNGLFDEGWAALGIAAFTLLVARPVAVFIALAGTATDVPTRAFMAWFGPKGVATMTFSLLVLAQTDVAANETVFNLAALAVFCSIIAHGLTDTAGANWIARHTERVEARDAEPVSAQPV
jgi:NhaP-type Na+/H+ or K+/H+ antiporter